MTVRMRATKGHRNNRRGAHHAIIAPALTIEGEATVPHMRHRASPITGMYRGRKVMDVDTKIAKKESKRAARNQTATEA